MPIALTKYYKLHTTAILLALASLLLYAYFAYQLERTDFPKLIALAAALFILLFKLMQFEKWNFKFLLVIGLLFRLVFMLAVPNLSQDFYRFIWDGELISQGLNPYLYTPNQLIDNTTLGILPNASDIANAPILHDKMGALSAKHYSNYPPINQLLFTLSSYLGMGSILGSIIQMRLYIVLADLGILYFGRKLLRQNNLSADLAFWYFLNPLVIIELTGNLHFEGVMLFFFIWALYLIGSKKHVLAAPIYAASILVKLVPLLFLPLFLRYFGLKKSIVFYGLTIGTCLLLFLPFYDAQFLENYSQTIGLWFSNFEFNASIYNIIKTIGVTQFDAKPWELIKNYGSLIKLGIGGFILFLAFYRKHQTLTALLGSMLLVLSCYYFFTATVHPWYLVFLLGLSLFTPYRFTLLWTALVFLSYFAYAQADFKENHMLLAIEYISVIGYLIYEIFKNYNIIAVIRKKT